VLHNNAGGSTAQDDTAVNAPLDEFWRAIKLDLYGTFLGCRFGIPELIKADGGSVINMSSNVALMGVAGRDCYTAAKGGIAAITRSLAVAYALQRVRVNAIAPSATMTERVKKLVAGNAALTRLADFHLLGLIEPNDIASTALYLASDESRQCRPIGNHTRHLLGENLYALGFGQRVALQSKVLVHSRNAGIADQHRFRRGVTGNGSRCTCSRTLPHNGASSIAPRSALCPFGRHKPSRNSTDNLPFARPTQLFPFQPLIDARKAATSRLLRSRITGRSGPCSTRAASIRGQVTLSKRQINFRSFQSKCSGHPSGRSGPLPE
jgi:hypothetical protein